MPARGASARSRRRMAAAAAGGHGEGASSERWLVTYADMLTLLLVLFIVLFSISVVNTSKFDQLKQSLAVAFGAGSQNILSGGTGLEDSSANDGHQTVVAQDVTGAATVNVPSQSIASAVSQLSPNYSQLVAQQINDYKAIESAINKALAANGMLGDLKFSIDSRGLIITVVTDDLLFGPNSDQLLARGTKLLSVIAPPLKNYPNKVEVDGYTNQDKVSTFPFPSGWALSSARASAVAYDLQGGGVADSRLTAVGKNDLDPLYSPSDPRASTYNRRVEIVVLSSLPADAGAQLAAAGAGATPSTAGVPK